ncbi:protein-ADP-ribose hydrolase [Shewanella youngdeokensis]|uniref:Protein-ADP-ribose hydrolase n=1 Tax=Shewanella youngdeokensis TaxID=2999068 RepID=A0ABZ0K279_9GAMM|nr:protein-ADP-ribose hydrolase [Shewanella sp. DAU334]
MLSQTEAVLNQLLDFLLAERGEQRPIEWGAAQKADAFRALCNVRPAAPAEQAMLKLQDQYLQHELSIKGVVTADELNWHGAVALWQGDITRLAVDGIVNAGNNALLGCFQPLHRCIDNAIHTFAGVQLRWACQQAMKGGRLDTAGVVVTDAFNLPSKKVLHTVGPIVRGGQPQVEQVAQLRDCYLSSLQQAQKLGLQTLAFCCLSTGEYGYPKQAAAEIAVSTVQSWLNKECRQLRVVFNVFTDEDKQIYETLLR